MAVSTAISAREFGVYWAAGMTEWIVTMDDGSKRRVAVPLTDDAEQKAIAKANWDARQEAGQ